MAHNEHHDHLIKELTELLDPVFLNSPQGVYLYLDDVHKACNQKFADMLGYSSPAEWMANEFPISDVVEEDRQKGIDAYESASRNFKASTISGTWNRKDGTQVHTDVTFVPLSYRGEVFVLHFVSEKKN